MDGRLELNRIMSKQTELALATVSDGKPNVRMVNFIYDEERGIIYFTTFNENIKIGEIAENPNVAFTSIPKAGNEHVKGRGTAYKSELSIKDVEAPILSKIPEYKATIDHYGQSLEIFEIRIESAKVTLNFKESVEVNF